MTLHRCFLFKTREDEASSHSITTSVHDIGGLLWHCTDCSYHEFEFATTSSIDVGISCGLKDISSSHTNSDGNGDTGAQADGVLYASLSITVILAIVVVIMVAVLTVLWLKKKKSGQR